MGGIHHNTVLQRAQNFIEKSIAVHGDAYDYSKVEYINDSNKVEIICKVHGSFFMRPNLHSSAKQGCPICAKTTQQTGIQRRHQQCKETFVTRAIATYGDKYDYTYVEYTGAKDPITIICKIHGDFVIKYAGEHLSARRECPHCTKISKSTKLRDHNIRSTGEFIAQAKQAHNFKYLYENTTYTGYAKPIIVTCPLHGEFTIKRGGDHIYCLQGCQACNRKMSKHEQVIKCILEDLNVKFIYQKTFKDCVSITSSKLLSFDFFLPDNNILIEFDGEQHTKRVPFFHSQERFEQQQIHDRIKTEYAVNNKYTLLRINNQTLNIKNTIYNILINTGANT